MVPHDRAVTLPWFMQSQGGLAWDELSMGKREVQRVDMLSHVLAGRISVVAAGTLAPDQRQVHGLPGARREDGAAALGHGASGR